MVRINQDLTIPDDELFFSAVRSSGPGGQNVNKVATKILLRFDVENSRVLTEDQKSRIRKILSSHLNKDGALLVKSQEHRSQSANRKAAIERFTLLIEKALRRRKTRKATRVPKSERKRRLEEKVRRSRLKSSRAAPPRDTLE